jgi:hypothetical protein
MSHLYDYLSALPPGPVEDHAELGPPPTAGTISAGRTDQLWQPGSSTGWKIPDGNPRFSVSLWSATGPSSAGGSTRAEMQHWVVDTRTATASICA